MNKFLIISFFSLLFVSCCKEQSDIGSDFNGVKLWSKTYGGSEEELVKSVTSTKDGGFLVIGTTKSNDGDINDKSDLIQDIWLSKYTSEGAIIWSRTYGGSLDDFGYSVIENQDGTLVVAGYSKSSDGDVVSNLGMHDFFIFKTTAQGDFIWKKNYGFSSHDHAHKVISTSDGGYMVVGYADYGGFSKNESASKHGVGEYYAIKLDANGDKVWDRYFGGTQNERIYDVVETSQGDYIFAGYSESNNFDAADNHGSYDYWLVRVDSSGDLLWKKSYGGTGLDQAFGIEKTTFGTYIIVGTTNSTDGDVSENKGQNDVWLLSVDENGNKIWDKSIGGLASEVINSIQPMRNGNFVLAGHTRSSSGDITENKGENDFWLVTISPTGGVLWQRTFGGSQFDFGSDAAELTDRGIVIVGETQSNDYDITTNKGVKDLLIVKVH